MEKQISKIVEDLYDMGAVIDVYEIFGGFTNRGFGIRTRKDSDRNTYFVRQYRDGVTLEEIRFEHALINHAIGNGLAICAGVVPARNGETLVQPANSDKVFAVYEYLSGEVKYTWDNTDLTDAEFRNAAGVLAEFHDAVRDFDPGRLKREEPPIMELLPIIARNFIHLGQKMCEGKIQSYYQANLKAILGAIERNPIAPQDIEGLPVIPIHCDFHPGNLKWDDDVVTGLFDFDWSKMDLRLFDVCMAIVYFCSQWGGRRDGELRMDKFAHFLGSYHLRLQSLEGLDPLSDNEQRLLLKMLTLANICLVHWEVSNFYATEEAVDNEYIVYLKHNVRLMRWLETNRPAIAETIANALG